MKTLFLAGAICLILCSCHPVDIEREIREGSKSASNGDWKTALEKAELCLDSDPSSSDAMILKSLAIFKLERTNPASVEKSLDIIRQVTQEQPDRYDGWFVYGWILLQCNKVDQAIPPLTKAYELHIKPENAASVTQTVQGSIQYILGEAYIRSNMMQNAEKMLAQSIKRTPYNGWASIYSDLGYIAFSKKNYKEAMKWFNYAYKLAPNDYAILVNMAVTVDFLSFKQFNSVNYNDFLKQRKGWYKNALNAISKARKSSTNAKEQVYLDNLAASIKKRAGL